MKDDPDFESGVGLSCANGLGQVSHDRVQEVLDSQVGDHVRMCLIVVPENCPPGEDRGRTHDLTSLRTGGMWSMIGPPDYCGGA